MDKYTVLVFAIAFFQLGERLLREDVQWFVTLRNPVRGIAVAALQMIVVPILDAALNGAGVWQALLTGVISLVPTILRVLGGLSATPAAIRAAKSALPTVSCMLLLGAMLIAGCAAARVACPIIHAVDEICPYVIVELTDGGVERISRTEIERLAQQHRAAWTNPSQDGGR